METFKIGYLYETFDDIIGVGEFRIKADDESELTKNAFKMVIDKLTADAFNSEFVWPHNIKNIEISVKKQQRYETSII